MNARIVFGFSLASAMALCLGCTGSGSVETRKEPPRAAAAPGALEAAHKAYLEGDFTVVTERIRDVLLDPSSGALAKENAYELLDKAYEAQGGTLPSTTKLSEPFGSRFQYGHIRGMGPNGPFYQAYFRGPIRDASRITNITVRRLPDEVILDKKTGKGRFQIKHDTPNFEDFNMDTGRIDALPADGVFTTRIELDDGTISEGWFIAHNLSASSTPDVRSPAPSESFSDPNPLLRWTPYRSAQYLPFERRILSVYVSHEGDDAVAWDLWMYDPDELGQLRIGNHRGADKATLAPGDYWIALSAGEERVFGPIRLVRSARSGGPFHVVR